MTSSWAGAIGHTQFVPTTYLSHAIDGDGDGKVDLWNSAADALASAANYLKQSGWQTGERWGQEVVLPDRISPTRIATSTSKSRCRNGRRAACAPRPANPCAATDTMAAIFLPAGHKGPAFLVRKNFHVILTYNAATSYALAVSLLSDRFRGAGDIVASWPRDELPLEQGSAHGAASRAERARLRRGRARRRAGPQDARRTARVPEGAQLPADGFATLDMLEHVQKDQHH